MMQGINIVALLLCLGLHKPAYRPFCKCAGESKVSDAVKYADCVFKGTVLSQELISNPPGTEISGDTLSNIYQFTKFPVTACQVKVEHIFKGKTFSDTL